jgi:aspartate/methionine/tyrosine aminotransferase
VACLPGTAFGGHGEGYLRLSYAAATDQLREALSRIGRLTAQAPVEAPPQRSPGSPRRR